MSSASRRVTYCEQFSSLASRVTVTLGQNELLLIDLIGFLYTFHIEMNLNNQVMGLLRHFFNAIFTTS